MHFIKSHAFGNDFLLVDEREVASVADVPGLARTVCERHRGIGADGLLIFGDGAGGTTMRLLNADGSAVGDLRQWTALPCGVAGAS